MKDHGIRLVEIRSLDYDILDVRERQKRPDVVELSKSRAKIALHPITVNIATREIVAGRDRIAADLLAGLKKTPVRYVEGTPEELLDMEAEENIRRRHGDRDALIADYVARKSAQAKESGGVINGQISRNSPGRPRSPKAAVREELAAKLHVTPDAIRKAEARAAAPEPAPAELPPPIALGGAKADAAWLAQVREVQEAVDAADKAGRAMQAALSRLETLPFPKALLQRLQRAAHAVTAEARAARPRTFCPTVHASGVMCGTCQGVMWVAADLETKGAVAVMKVPGAFAKIASAGMKPAARALSIKLTDANGDEIPFREGTKLPGPDDIPEEEETF